MQCYFYFIYTLQTPFVNLSPTLISYTLNERHAHGQEDKERWFDRSYAPLPAGQDSIRRGLRATRYDFGNKSSIRRASCRVPEGEQKHIEVSIRRATPKLTNVRTLYVLPNIAAAMIQPHITRLMSDRANRSYAGQTTFNIMAKKLVVN
jgi:hypothetical protein